MVVIGDLSARPGSNALELCDEHADGLRPPVGWQVTDVRARVSASR